MKVLIVANYNTGSFSPFVVEQVDSMRPLGIEFDYFGIVGKGSSGYLKNLPALRRKIKEFKPDVVHAHYGLSGLLATLQRSVPVVVTYHGSDIHGGGLNLMLSRLAMRRAAKNIIVSKPLQKIAGYNKNVEIIPCGVDDATFHPMDKAQVRENLGWDSDGKYILFAGAFDREVKNPKLAIDAVSQIEGCKLVELKGYSRKEVCELLNASDCLLMTSHNEGSPQIIKEAMLCGTPIVSVPVGDVGDVSDGVDGCYIVPRNIDEIKQACNKALRYNRKTNGRDIMLTKKLALHHIALKIHDIYNQVIFIELKDN